jgi:hypothetical protein
MVILLSRPETTSEGGGEGGGGGSKGKEGVKGSPRSDNGGSCAGVARVVPESDRSSLAGNPASRCVPPKSVRGIILICIPYDDTPRCPNRPPN